MAAWAIGAMLFHDQPPWPQVRPAVESLCNDRSTAVRSAAVKCVLALLNINRDEAVRLSLNLAGARAVLGTGEVPNFLYHAQFSHYVALRGLLLEMLQLPDEKARHTAARQITVASFSKAEAKEDLAVVLAGDKSIRKAAAEIFAHNLKFASASDTCRTHLIHFFSDSEKDVRQAAAGCFRGLPEEVLTSEAALIGLYIKSPAFLDGAGQLIWALEKCSVLLPDIVAAIPAKIIERLSIDQTTDVTRRHHDTYQVPELVMRLYRQTTDPATRVRCLDLMDVMLENGFDGLETELNNVER